MSLENHIQALTAAVVALTQQLQAGGAPAAAPVPQAAPAAAPFTPPAAAPAAAPAGMPGAPFGAPAAAPAACPITDPKTLMDYSMASFQAMSQAKGQDVATARFNQILAACGVDNINNVPAAQYANYYSLMEQAKVAA